MKIEKYNSYLHSKFLMKYHIIFSTKYRRNILIGNYQNIIKEYMKLSEHNQLWNIETMEIDNAKPNHIHFLINSNPYICVNDIVKRLKQFSTFYIWKDYYEYISKIYWKKHCLWTKGYFCCTIGDASIDTIRKYIENQG